MILIRTPYRTYISSILSLSLSTTSILRALTGKKSEIAPSGIPLRNAIRQARSRQRSSSHDSPSRPQSLRPPPSRSRRRRVACVAPIPHPAPVAEPRDHRSDGTRRHHHHRLLRRRRRRRRRRRKGGGGSGRARKKTLIRLSSSSVPNSHHVYVDVHPSALRALPVRYRAGLWGDVVDVADVGDEAAAFVSEVVCRDDPSFADVRVVSLLPDNATSRSVDARYCPYAARVGYFGSLPHGGLTDGFPVSASSRFAPPPPPTSASFH